MSTKSRTRSPAAGLRIEVEVTDASYVLRLAGELDLAAVPRVEEELVRALPNSARIVIDVERVSFIDSSGLKALLAWRRRCHNTGVDFTLTPGTPEVRRVFEITGLLDRLPGLRRRRRRGDS